MYNTEKLCVKRCDCVKIVGLPLLDNILVHFNMIRHFTYRTALTAVRHIFRLSPKSSDYLHWVYALLKKYCDEIHDVIISGHKTCYVALCVNDIIQK
jgi:hypothetical protein